MSKCVQSLESLSSGDHESIDGFQENYCKGEKSTLWGKNSFFHLNLLNINRYSAFHISLCGRTLNYCGSETVKKRFSPPQ